MRRYVLSVMAALAAVMVLASSPSFAGSTQSDAIKALMGDVAKALPGDRKMTRVAVLDFKGDEGNLVRNAVTSAINEKTAYKVMERIDFSKILEEQGLQLKDIMDEKTRIRHGRLRGVQGLLIGDVYRLQSGFMSYDVKANIRLVDVEKGEVLLSRDFESHAVAPERKYVVVGAGACALLIVFALFFSFRARRARRLTARMRVLKGTGEKEGVVAEIEEIMGNLSEAKSRLVETGKTADAVEIKDIERSLMNMKRSVADGVYGLTGIDGNARLYRGPHMDKEVIWRLVDMNKLSRKIRLIALTPTVDGMEREIGALKADLNNVLGGLDYRRASAL